MSRFPVGRPAAVRAKFTNQFLNDFMADWELGGAAAIKTVRMRDPSTYVRIGASILPKEMVVETLTSGLSAEERFELLTRLKQELLMRQEPMLLEARKINEDEPERA